MFQFVFMVVLCSNLILIKSEDTGLILIDIIRGEDCTIESNSYTLSEGQKIILAVSYGDLFIDHGWWRLTKPVKRDLFDKLKNTQQQILKTLFTHITSVDKSMEGKWEFQFLYYPDNIDFKPNKIFNYKGTNYTEANCTTEVKIMPLKTGFPSDTNLSVTHWVIVIAVVSVLALLIIAAQTAFIVFLKAKAQRLNAHNNLSKKTEPPANDTARYCSTPGQKMMKVAAPVDDNSDDDNRDSVIYEAPNIELPGNGRMQMQPPQPPAITTMPRTPRPEHNLKINRQAFSAQNSPQTRSPTENHLPNFPRPKHIERETSVANRPPLPLPHQNQPHKEMFEVYEQMDTEDNTYEPPPIINTMPPKLPMPPKKVPIGNLLDVKEDTLKKNRSNKPPLTPKPQRPRSNQMIPTKELDQALKRRNNETIPKQTNELEQALRRRNQDNMIQTNELDQALKRRNNNATNELEEALRRRNNVKQVPIMSIPDNTRASPMSKPPPAAKPMPAAFNHPVQEEIYYNENQESSDEEWTYEPLKPFKIYDPNIYNV